MTDKPDTSPAAVRALADDPRARRSSASEMEWLFDMRRMLRALADEKEAWERDRAAAAEMREALMKARHALAANVIEYRSHRALRESVEAIDAALATDAGYVIGMAAAAASPVPEPRTTVPSPAISEE